MTLIIPPGFCNAAFVFSSSVGTAPFVTTLAVDSSDYGGDFVNLANSLKAAYAVFMGPATDSALTLDRVSLAVGTDGPGGSVDSTTAPQAMTRTSTGQAMAVSVIIRKVTNQIGRRGRGRMFAPGTLSQSEVGEDGSVAPARATDINTRMADLLEFLVEGDTASPPAPPVLLHSQAPADPTPIVGFAVADLIGIQRGRIR